MKNNNNSFCYWDQNTLVLNILGTPSAKQDKILKPRGNQLKVSVTASPEDGKATNYMVKFLSKEFAVKRSAITVVFGQTSIHKQLRIESPQKLPAVIKQYLDKNYP